ncbi:MAG: peptidase M16 [Rhodospirillaceae bacterium]|nr:peptidase M16 [Rhodospirillaceae bacterium]
MSAEVTVLENGIRIVSEFMDSVETASLGVWVDVGARDEDLRSNGISHLLEHMAFKGTTNRTARCIAEQIEAVGGHLNAYTSREQTAYYAKVMRNDINLAVDILSDILLNSTFDSEELLREKSVVLQEIAQVQDTPDDQIFDFFQEVAYPNQALGRNILGSVKQVSGYERNNLLDYMEKNYTPGRMVISAAGAVNHDLLVSSIKSKFGHLKGCLPHSRIKANYVGGKKIVSRDLEQIHFTVGFDSLSIDDNDFYALQIFSTLLGGGMSSRLFQEVREQRGLAYSVFTFTSAYIDGGSFGVYVGTSKDKINELLTVLVAELSSCSENITSKEVNRSRAQLKSNLLMSLESTSSRCERLARQTLIFGQPISIKNMIEQLDGVSIDDIRRIADRIIFSSFPSTALLGPVNIQETSTLIQSSFESH